MKTSLSTRILLISLLIFLIFVGLVIYLSVTYTTVTLKSRCLPGVCSINYTTGLKICPSGANSSVDYNIGFEGCSSRWSCNDPKAPYAQLPDGSTSNICIAGGENCRCINKIRCPYFNTIYYTLNSGVYNQVPYDANSPELETTSNPYCFLSAGVFSTDQNGFTNINPPYCFSGTLTRITDPQTKTSKYTCTDVAVCKAVNQIPEILRDSYGRITPNTNSSISKCVTETNGNILTILKLAQAIV
jgi:hypothetical protein